MRRKRTIFFVCSAIQNSILISEEIISTALEKAKEQFLTKFNLEPATIFGPFFKKKVRKSKVKVQYKFSPHTRKAIYQDWVVNAMILSEPKDFAYLLFSHRVDQTKATPPKEVIIPIQQLRFI